MHVVRHLQIPMPVNKKNIYTAHAREPSCNEDCIILLRAYIDPSSLLLSHTLSQS